MTRMFLFQERPTERLINIRNRRTYHQLGSSRRSRCTPVSGSLFALSYATYPFSSPLPPRPHFPFPFPFPFLLYPSINSSME
ncbi:hypothetical protein CPB83DRAFT_864748 [Crepidotus variabilis]|uniref:Uncharacterized protein n=1 Tax=Crepidotus variabilis TaxID=179855 RepID=A0A9P6E4H1_9AGAR|nr:hypothetical protein CPB83DRAFT_864748 [Crepidotus variabilis]